MEKVLIILGAGILYIGIIFLLLRWAKKSRLRDMKKVADKMVESGEITRSEADAIIWIINYSSRKKK